jgi:hypothetical protein
MSVKPITRVRELLLFLLKNQPKVRGASFQNQSGEPLTTQTLHQVGPITVYISWRTPPSSADILELDDVLKKYEVVVPKKRKKIFYG